MAANNMTTKKVGKFNRRGKLQRMEGTEDPEGYEKQELVKILMVKCSKTKDEVLNEYDEFFKKNPNGSITKEEYINSTEVDQQYHLLYVNNVLNCLSHRIF